MHLNTLWFCVILCVYVAVFAVFLEAKYIDNACVVQKEVTLPWSWSEKLLRVWVPSDPPGDTPVDHSRRIISMFISFTEKESPTDIIRLRVTKTHLLYAGIGDTECRTINLTTPLPMGWVIFKLEVNETLTISYVTTSGNAIIPEPSVSTILLQEPVRLPVSSVRIHGSNISINCLTGDKMWILDKKTPSQAIPLDEEWSRTQLVLYSNLESLPRFRLGAKEVTLSWQNGTLTSLSLRPMPLPAFTEHVVTFECSHRDDGTVRCDLLLDLAKRRMETFFLAATPSVLVVEGRTSDAIHILIDPHEKITNGEILDILRSVALVVLFISLVMTLLAILGYPRIMPKIKNYRNRNNTEQTFTDSQSDSAGSESTSSEEIKVLIPCETGNGDLTHEALKQNAKDKSDLVS